MFHSLLLKLFLNSPAIYYHT